MAFPVLVAKHSVLCKNLVSMLGTLKFRNSINVKMRGAFNVPWF